MNKKDYIIKQLRRTSHKGYEMYVVSRIVHLLNDFKIKFVTQQYVIRPNNRYALVDLFFPQLKLYVEVNEGQHDQKEHAINDKIRKQDIVAAIDYEQLDVDIFRMNGIEDINKRVDEIVEKIKNSRQDLDQQGKFRPWDFDNEFDPEFYINLGHIKVSDNVTFRTIKDACNCFGHHYSGYQRAGASHPHDQGVMLWFPKLFKNDDWDNSITSDEKTITEKNTNPEKAREHIENHICKRNGEKHKRIIFAKAKGNLGYVLYRFKGLYELNLNKSNVPNGLIWERIATEVKTYPSL